MPTRFEDGLGYLIHHLMYAFRQKLSEQCARSGYAMTADELTVLMITAQGQSENGCRQNGLKQADIAAILAKDKAVITRRINSLLKQGLVVRTTDNKDRRAVRISLSADGVAAVAHLRPQLEQVFRRIYHDIDQQEFDIARGVLMRILHNVSESEESWKT